MDNENKTPMIILITCGTQDEANLITDALVRQNLIACGNIIPEVKSIFRWENRLTSDQETLIIAKSHAQLFSRIVTEVKQRHSYKNPEILALPIINGSEEYLNWVFEETAPSTD